MERTRDSQLRASAMWSNSSKEDIISPQLGIASDAVQGDDTRTFTLLDRVG